MAGTLAAQRYAKALLSLAAESDQLDNISADMRLIHHTITDSKELRSLLRNPVIKAAQKRACLKEIFSDIHQQTSTLFDVLIENKRLGLLPKVAEVATNLIDDLNQIVTAKVTTAVPMTEKVESDITAKIKAITKSEKVSLTKSVDENLVGGFLLRIGDLEFDGSISGKLNNLRHKFKQNSYA